MKIRLGSDQEFQQQNADTIDQCNGKDALGGFVLVCIDIISEEGDISHEAPDTSKSDQLLFAHEKIEVFIKGVT